MNKLQIMNAAETPATTNNPQSELPIPQSLLAPPLKPADRRKGKIARLPRAVREQINQMIDDGVPYLQIIERLGPDGQGLTESNLCNWKAGGYVDWLRQLQITDAIHAKYELAENIVKRPDHGNAAGQAVLQVIATNLCEFLTETDPSTLRESLLSDADKFTRFVNAMVRLAEGGIKCERHTLQLQDRVETHAKNSPEHRGISEESLREAEEKLKLL